MGPPEEPGVGALIADHNVRETGDYRSGLHTSMGSGPGPRLSGGHRR